jgi:glycosyltransferase involved in cell wall biosynthesis
MRGAKPRLDVEQIPSSKGCEATALLYRGWKTRPEIPENLPRRSSGRTAERRKPVPKYSVIIPAHNEAGRIERTLQEYAEVFIEGELIVVLNACTDATADAVNRVAAPRLRAVEIREPIGKGGAVRAGFLLARAPLVGFTDADGSTPATEMRRLFDLLGHHDAAIGSRWSRGARLDPPQTLTRRVASRAFNLLAHSLTRLPFSDTQCGAKVFRADVLADVIQAVETANFAFDVDLLAALVRRGARIVEVPIEWHDRSKSRIRIVPASARMAGALLRLAIRRSGPPWALSLFDRIVPTRPMTNAQLRAAFSNRIDLRIPEPDET